MKRKYVYLCGTIVLSFLMIFSFNSCKGFGIPDFQLTVTVQPGISGSPVSDVYTYEELTEVEYNYFPENEEHTVEVLINGVSRIASGSVIMFTDINIAVNIFDIRGVWNFTLNPPSDAPGEEDIEFQATFTGSDLISGTFTDDRGFSGVWSINGSALTISFNDWLNYTLAGTIPTMTGAWQGENRTGNWRAIR
ncbi:MAG: hypothetical protein GY940_29255 [bacterium]|nr:hypothetical protein [bacterium]